MKYSERMERLLDMYPEYRVVADEIFEEGRQENNGEVALKLRKYGVDPEIIEKCTGFNLIRQKSSTSKVEDEGGSGEIT